MAEIAFIDSARPTLPADPVDDKLGNQPDKKSSAAPQDPVEDTGKNRARQDSPPDSVEVLARKLGWKPQKDWKGDKSGWTPADEFITSKLKAGERTSKSVKKLEARVAEFGSLTTAALARQRAALTIEFERERETLIKKGDVAGVRTLEKERDEQLDKLKAPVIEEDDDEDSELAAAEEMADAILDDPLASSFFEQHAWVLDDDQAKVYDWIESYGEILLKKGKTPYEMFKELGAILQEKNPGRYKRSERRQEDPERKPNGQYQQKRSGPHMNAPARSGGSEAIWGRSVPVEYMDVARAEVKDGLFKSVDEWAKAFLESKQ